VYTVTSITFTCDGGMFDIARSYVSLTASGVDSFSIRRM
jgi:hypothetical protein